MDKPNILYLCGYPPLPLIAGNRHRIYHIGKILKELGNVTLCVISKFPLDDSAIKATQNEFGECIFINLESFAHKRNISAKLRRLLDKKWVVGRVPAIRENEQKLIQGIICQNDVIWIHTLQVADIVGLYKYPKSVIDLDDMNSIKYLLYAKIEKSFYKKMQNTWRFLLWKRWERDTTNRFTISTVCSAEDKKKLGGGNQIHVVPNGIEISEKRSKIKRRNQMYIGFLGILDYYPNIEGLNWFAEKIFPMLISKVPSVHLRVIGKFPSTNIKIPIHPNIDILGFVEDHLSEMDGWAALVVPIRIGGGTRIKILDAFSNRCPVITTSVGAYGLGVESERHLLIADSEEQFVRACLRSILEPDTLDFLVENARNLAATEYNWNGKIRENVEKAVSCLIH